MKLISDNPGCTPNYWCTWGTQNNGRHTLPPEMLTGPELFEGNEGAQLARDYLTEDVLFNEPGWAVDLFPEVRSDLFLVLDDGWDVSYGVGPAASIEHFGSLIVDETRFPSFFGTPAERLRKLNDAIKGCGWRGLGLWIACQCPGETWGGELLNDAEAEAYWRERARWCREAGVEYWKIDWGVRMEDQNFRRMLMKVAREEYPGLIVEQGRPYGPWNDWNPVRDKDGYNGTGRFLDGTRAYEETLNAFGFSDVLRGYDVDAHLAVASMLDRISEELQHGAPPPDMMGLLNSEDEVYMGAALGLAFGVMRSPYWQNYTHYHSDPRGLRKRAGEVVRACRWQRIAPAFRVGTGKTATSDELLTDTHSYKRSETWCRESFGVELSQSAPAVLGRNIELPQVKCNGEPPFVVAARNPNRAISVATLTRTSSDTGPFFPLAEVTLNVGDASGLIGVFGYYDELVLESARSINQVWAQDLAESEAIDITDRADITGTRITLSGQLIREIGCSQSPDESDPGLVLALR